MLYTLALLDDHRVVLESFANLLATSDDFQVVGMAHDQPSLLGILAQSPVDVLVTDLLLPGLTVTELIPFVKNRYPRLAVLVLSGTDDPAQVRHVMQCGANGFVTKTADKAELFDAIRAVAGGRRYLDSRLFELENAWPVGPEESPLTEREREVARLILEELSSTEIAERLFISSHTVESHRKHIYQKLGISTSLGLMKYSLKQGFLKR
jgi:DNA-binding NarL/FixJ family response regulator